MAIGMSRDEYWNGDSDAVIDYRKADELRQKRVSEEQWLLGRYIYETIARISPLPVFLTDGRGRQEYIEKPYWIEETRKDESELSKAELEKRAKQSAEAFRIMMINANKKFEGRGDSGAE